MSHQTLVSSPDDASHGHGVTSDGLSPANQAAVTFATITRATLPRM
jgi:hypothetical protein